MMRVFFFGLTLVVPAAVLAQAGQHEIEIVSPTQGVCVNNGGFVADAVPVGGQAQPDRRDVPLVFTARSPDSSNYETVAA